MKIGFYISLITFSTLFVGAMPGVFDFSWSDTHLVDLPEDGKTEKDTKEIGEEDDAEREVFHIISLSIPTIQVYRPNNFNNLSLTTYFLEIQDPPPEVC